MNLKELPLEGAFLLELHRHRDERGDFTRLFDREAFERLGLVSDFPQCALSANRRAATLRGLHFQEPPHAETKMVTCTRGRVYDVIVDLRAGSGEFGAWHGVELAGGDALGLYIPAGFAHGFITLEADSEVHYLISQPWMAASSGGIRWDDRDLAIDWPMKPAVISRRDRQLPLLCKWKERRE